MKKILLLILAFAPCVGHTAGIQAKAPLPKAPPKGKAPDPKADPGKEGDPKSAEGKDKDAKKGPMKFPKYHPLSPTNPHRRSAFADDLSPQVWHISTG